MVLNDNQRRLRRSKDAERYVAKWYLYHDSEDPVWKHITSSSGRVGFITGLQFDTVSRTYAVEVKNIKVPANLWKFWMQIVNIAKGQGKEPALVIVPTNEGLGIQRTYPNLHIISETRHEQLLRAERLWDKASTLLDEDGRMGEFTAEDFR